MEQNAWDGFKSVILNFLGKTKSNYYESSGEFGIRMSVNTFLYSHLGQFAASSLAFSEKRGERFHQDMRNESRKEGR